MGLTVDYTKGIVAPVDGVQLRGLRARAGLTQAALAARVGVAPNSVARWERNERTITKPMARLIQMMLAPSNRKRKGG